MPSAPAASEPAEPIAPSANEDLGPGLYGVVDVLRADRIAGWVIDRRDSQAALEVDVWREGRLIATVRADRARRDLERTGVGTGRYGFVHDIEPPLEPGFEFSVTAVARAADGLSAELRRPGSKQPVDPDRRLAERIFEELTRLGQKQAAMAQTPPKTTAEDLREIVQGIEVAQARIEAALAAVEPAAPGSQVGLKLMLGLALAVATLSLAIGVYSMLQP